jgi:dUTPase
MQSFEVIQLRYQNPAHPDLLPSIKYPDDVGTDIPAPHGIVLYAGQYVRIATCLYVDYIEPGYYIELFPRGGSLARGLHIQTGIIDTGYRGEIGIGVEALKDVVLLQGQGLAQLVVRAAYYPQHYIQINGQKITPQNAIPRGDDGGIWRAGR